MFHSFYFAIALLPLAFIFSIIKNIAGTITNVKNVAKVNPKIIVHDIEYKTPRYRHQSKFEGLNR